MFSINPPTSSATSLTMPNKTASRYRTIHRTMVAAALSCLGLGLNPISAAAQQNVQFLPNVSLIAGTGTAGYTGDGGPALSATFAAAATGAVADPFGNIYVTDSGNSVIRRIDAVTGIITTFAGGGTICSGGDKYGNNCPATQAILNKPQEVRYYKGDIYIVDDGDNEIRKVSGTTGNITAFYGTGGTALLVGGKAANATAINSPTDLVFDPAGNAYVASAGGKPFVSVVAATPQMDGTGIVTIICGNGTGGNTGDGGPAVLAEIQAPTGVALDPQGNLYIAGGSPNNIRKITNPLNIATSTIITYVGASGGGTAGFSGDGGPSNLAQLNAPQHIAFDGAGNLYIADQTNHRVRKVTPPAAGATYGTINTYVGNGTVGSTGNGGPPLSAELSKPADVEFTAAGDLIIMDGGVEEVREVSAVSLFPATNVGSTSTATASVQFINAITLGSFGVPSGYPDFASATPSGCTVGSAVALNTICTVSLTFQPTKTFFRLAPLVVKSSTGIQDILSLIGLGNAPAAAVLPGLIGNTAGTGQAGNSGDNGPATAALLNAPGGIAVDGQNNYYFADTVNNEVRKISSSGVITRVAGTGTAGFSGDGGAATSAMLSSPAAVVVDGAGDLYIADTGNNRIRFVSAATGLISTFAGTGVAGYTGDASTATTAELSGPTGLYLYPAGVLYIADTGNNVVRTVGVRSGYINTVAGNGTSGYTGDTLQAQLATLNAPSGVAVDNTGNIYIADTGNQLIRKVTNGIITTFAGVTTAGYSDSGLATAEFRNPGALAIDAASDIYVADTGNNVIRRLSGGQSTTVAGNGTAGSTGNGGSSTAATLNGPRGLALDQSGNILIADTSNNAIRSINVSADSITFPTTSPNTTSAAQTVSLTNAGNKPLAIAGIAIPTGFVEQPSGAVDCNGTSVSIASAGACEASIAFAPTAAQTYSGTVAATDNSQSQTSAKQSIAVTGIGAYVFTATIAPIPTSTAGVAQTVTVTVTNPAATYTGTLHFTSSDPKAVLPADYTYTSANNGNKTFSVTFGTAGMDTLTVTDTVTPSITATAIVTVVGGAPASLAIISGNSQSTLIFTNYKLPLVVEAFDAFGNPSSGASVTFTAPSSGADVTFSGNATYSSTTNSLGLITTPVPLADGVIGTFAVTAAAPGISPVSFSLTNTSNVALGFTLTSNPTSINSLPPGASATATITLTPVGGFNAAVNVACTGAISTTTCQLSTATVAASGNGAPTNLVLTVTTTGPAQAGVGISHGPFLACIALLFSGLVFRRRKKLYAISLTLACGMALVSLSGCSGSNLFTNSTLPGSFNLTITGTSGNITSSVVVPCFVAGKP